MNNIEFPTLNNNIEKDFNELDRGSIAKSFCVSESESPSNLLGKRKDKHFKLDLTSTEEELVRMPESSSSSNGSEDLRYFDSGYESFNQFANLKKILNKIFLNEKVSESDYSECSEFEQKLLKQLLVRKHRLKSTHFVMQDEDLDSEAPFKFETINSLSGMTSCKRKNEMYEYVIKSFIDHEIEMYRERNISKNNPDLSEKFHSMVSFFKHFFPDQTKTDEETKVIFSTFIKLNGLKNKKLKLYFGLDMKKYKKNYKFKKCVELIKKEARIRDHFAKYLSGGQEAPIVRSCKQIIREKIKKKVDQMREHFIFRSKKCKETFLQEFIYKLQKSKSKLPMLVLDIRQYSQTLFDILASDSQKIKY